MLVRSHMVTSLADPFRYLKGIFGTREAVGYLLAGLSPQIYADHFRSLLCRLLWNVGRIDWHIACHVSGAGMDTRRWSSQSPHILGIISKSVGWGIYEV